jgi:hypothetical protein
MKRNVAAVDCRAVMSEGACRFCGDRLGPFEVEHLVPLCRGGSNDLSNLACSCVSCNTQKGTMLLHEWAQWRQHNGMDWPPPARHATSPIHYQDQCNTCRIPSAPYKLTDDGRGGYVGTYRCSIGHTWRCWWSISPWHYSDCPCDFCARRRLEDTFR